MTAGDVTYTFTDMPASTTLQSVSATGLSVDINGFVTLTGDLAFEKHGTDLVAAGDAVTAALSAGAANVTLADADFGLRADTGTAFELKNGTFSAAIDGLASVTAAGVLVQYTGTTTTVAANTTLTVGGTSYTFAEGIAANTVAVEATGFSASVADFVTLSGDLGFKKSGANIIAVGTDVDASLAAGPANVTLSDADFGLQAGDGKTAFELKNGAFSATIDGLASVTAAGVLVQYTGATTTVAANTALTVGGTSYTFAEDIAANTVAVEATGFRPTWPTS